MLPVEVVVCQAAAFESRGFQFSNVIRFDKWTKDVLVAFKSGKIQTQRLN